MSETAVDRVARVLDLVPFALENPGIEVSVLANKFNVSEKQILADLELIFLCGLPGYTPYELIDLSFEDGVVTVIDPQVLDKPRLFNEIEAVVLHLGLSIMKNAIDDLNKQSIISDLQEKIAAKFSAVTDISFTTNKPRFYDLVSDSIKNNYALHLTYTSVSRDEVSDRIVLPKSVYLAQGNFYFTALDTQNNQIRHFRMDLIQSCLIATEVPDSNSVLPDNDEVFDFKIKSRSKYLTERYGDLFTDVTQQGDTYVAEGKMSNSQWLRRLVLSNAPDLELLEPAFLKEEIRDEMQLVLRLYQ